MIPFEKEVALIKNEKIRETTNKILCHMPKWFMKEGASSTGKYHPSYAQGEGGLYRHTCAAVKIFHDITNLKFIRENDITHIHDWGIAALILHDICKYGYEDTPSRYVKFDHPLLVRKWLEHLQYEDSSIVDEEYIECVCNLVESHMGEWTTSKYQPGIVLPEPDVRDKFLVHLADYLASRKYLEVKFDE